MLFSLVWINTNNVYRFMYKVAVLYKCDLYIPSCSNKDSNLNVVLQL